MPVLLIGLNYPSQPLWAALPVFIFNIVIMAFPFTWLYRASMGSPLVVAVMHAALNAAGDGFASPAHLQNGNPLVVGGGGLITTALVLVIVVLRYTIVKHHGAKGHLCGDIAKYLNAIGKTCLFA